MAPKRKFEAVALPIGETLLGFDAFRYFLYLIDTYSRFNTVVALNNFLPDMLSNPLAPPTIFVAGLALIYFYVDVQIKHATHRASPLYGPDDLVITSRMGRKWLWTKVGTICVAAVLAVGFSMAWLLRYNPPVIALHYLLPKAPEIAPSSPPVATRKSLPEKTPSSPLIGAGAVITQDTRGSVDSPAIISGGSVTINPDVNPNRMRLAYNCAGIYREIGSMPDTAVYVGDTQGRENIQIWNDMAHANNAKDWTKLLTLCTTQIREQPEWISPYLFCAMAHLGLSEKEKARAAMEYYDKHTGPAYDADKHCADMADYVRARLP
jgi:hypothetical protein